MSLYRLNVALNGYLFIACLFFKETLTREYLIYFSKKKLFLKHNMACTKEFEIYHTC